jgi:hypothetical protein
MHKIIAFVLTILVVVPFTWLPSVNAQGTPTLYMWYNNDDLENAISSYLGINVKNVYDKPFAEYSTNYILLKTNESQLLRDNNTPLPVVVDGQNVII